MIEWRDPYVLKCLETQVEDEDLVATQVLVLEGVEAGPSSVVPKPSIFSQPASIRQAPNRGLMNDDDAPEAGKNHPKWTETLNWKIIR